MTSERLKWVLGGLDLERLNKLEREFIKQIGEKVEHVEDITPYQERRLEQIYRAKSQ